MPTEKFEIAYSGSARRSRLPGQGGSTIADATKSALVASGWNFIGGVSARAELFCPFGAPTYTPPNPPPSEKRAAGSCQGGFVGFAGVSFCFYDPSRQHPGTGPGLWVAMDQTVAGSLGNLVAAMNAVIPNWTFTVRYEPTKTWKWYIDALGNTALGPLLNNTPARHHGGWNVWSKVHYGGWIVESAGGEASQYRVTLYEDYFDDVAFRLEANGGTTTYYLSPYDIWATADPTPHTFTMISTHQFAIWIDDGSKRQIYDQVGGARNNWALLASAPWIKPGRGIDYCVFAFQNKLSSYRQTLSWAPISVALNGPLVTFDSNFQARGGPVVTKFPFDAPLLTTKGQPVIHNAWPALAPNASAEARIVGKLWDAVLISDDYRLASEMMLDNHGWIIAGRQDGKYGSTRFSLWLCYTN